MPKSKNSLSELLYDIKRIAEHREKLSEKRIQAIYRTLSEDLDRFIADGYKKYADEDGRFYLSYLDAHNKRASFLQEIVNKVDNISPQIKKEIIDLIDETYDKSYSGMIKSFKQADTAKEFEDITKDIDVNPHVLKQAVNNNISKLTLPLVMEKHRQETIYQIQKELNIGLMQGDRYEKMAKRISERVNVSYNKAMNITRTETHRNIESGFMDCAEHIQKGLDGSDLIYAATWRTMKDEKVRPNQRRKTKKGWVTRKSKNGANHQMMEGITVKAGELFDLGGGVKTKAPSQSGVAAHDCNCRCFLEYNLMTVEEFAKATGKKVEKGVENDGERGIIKLAEDEQRALNYYISSDSYKINEKLRNKDVLDADDEELIKNLDKALDKMPDYRGTVYRSIYVNNANSFLDSYRIAVGKTKVFSAYMSTGVTVYDSNAPVQYVIKSKNGKDIRLFNEEEQEVLFRRKTKFEILKVEGTTIYMEEK